MSWLDYYHLLEKYGGDIKKATPKEMKDAALGNPNTPTAAFKIAKEKYQKEYATTKT